MLATKPVKNAIFIAAWMTMAVLPMGAFAQDGTTDSGTITQPAPATGDSTPVALKATVQSFEGNCFYRHSEDQDWKPLEQGIELGVGGQIKTGLRGTVQVAVGSNADVTIKPLTVMTIGQLEQDGDTLRTLLAMPQGKFEFHVKKVGFQNDFKVATPTGTMAVKGTQGSVGSFGDTNIDGNNNNSNNSIVIEDNSTGEETDLSGNQEYDGEEIVVNATGPGVGGGGNDNGGGSGTEGGDNSNSGDGNGNGGTPDANLDSLSGNDSNMNSMMEFEMSLPQAPPGGDG